MRDRVAEVLAERATLDNGAAAGLALSAALHAGITAAVFYLALHRPAPEMANVLTIKFAPPEMTAPVVSTPPKKAAVAPPHTTAPVVPPPTVVAPPKPVAKNTAPPDAFGRSTKKPAAVPAPSPPAVTQQTSNPATTPGVANVNDITAGSSGVTGLEGGDFPYTIYIDRMKNLIGAHWFRPQGATATATVHFVINRDGTIRDVTLETPSGNSTYDRAVQRAVIEASPLPPLPFAYSGTYLGVHLTFR